MQAAPSLPRIEGVYELSPAQMRGYVRDGHVKLEAVLAAEELAAWRGTLKRAVEAETGDASKPGPRRNCNIWKLDATARRFVHSPRLARVAADLLNVEAVRLLRDEPYFKNSGDLNTPWHQDGYFIPLDTDRMVTLWIPLGDLTSDMAPMTYASGSHTAGFLGLCPPVDRAMDEFEQRMQQRGLAFHNYGSFRAGDIAAHDGRTLHSSRKNRSERPREVLIIIYFADGARVADPTTLPAGGPPLETLLPGTRPGDLADGPETPLVYCRSWEKTGGHRQ